MRRGVVLHDFGDRHRASDARGGPAAWSAALAVPSAVTPALAPPVRTATGVAILAFFGVLTLAGGNDVIAFYLSSEVEALTRVFQVLVIVLPVVAWIVAYRVSLARGRRASVASGPPRPGGRPRGGTALRRSEQGGFEEVEP